MAGPLHGGGAREARRYSYQTAGCPCSTCATAPAAFLQPPVQLHCSVPSPVTPWRAIDCPWQLDQQRHKATTILQAAASRPPLRYPGIGGLQEGKGDRGMGKVSLLQAMRRGRSLVLHIPPPSNSSHPSSHHMQGCCQTRGAGPSSGGRRVPPSLHVPPSLLVPPCM